MSPFITFEGPEGCGKTTQANRLKKSLIERGHEVVLTREPGGTPMGKEVRDILLNPDHDELTPLAELFLYEASRTQHVNDVIVPALEDDKIVLSDRFSDASLVYQGMARDLDLDIVDELNDLSTNSLKPDLTVILDVDPQNGLDRARMTSENYDRNGDRIERESINFHQRVQKGYHRLARREPERCVLFDRERSIDSIHEDILRQVEELLAVEE